MIPELTIVNPSTNEIIETLLTASADDVQEAVRRSRKAFQSWRNVPLHNRVGRLRKLALLIRENADHLAHLLTIEVGKVRSEAEGEVEVCARLMEGYANQALHSLWHALPGEAQPGIEHDLMIVSREPLGVMGAILPFNFPLDILAHKVAPSLAVGNTVIVKPSEDAPLAVQAVAKLAYEAGIDSDVFQIVIGAEETGKALVAADIDAISFTGSAEVGIVIATQRAKHLTPTLLELGGNDVAIILDDADIELAVNAIMDSRILANGQVCCSTKRVLTPRSIRSDVIEALADKMSALKVGDPRETGVNVGPLINPTAASRVAQQLSTVIDYGATMLYGSGKLDGNFVSPTLLIDVQPDNPVASDMEIFAPVLPVIQADDIEEAIAIANASRYGLNGSVFSRDIARAISVARRLEAGTISINGAGLFRADALPFGGYKHSGFGREGFTVSLDELTQPKTINLRGYWN